MPPYPCPVSTWRTAAYAAINPLLPGLSSKGKNVVVTGGGSGIGAAIANAFGRSGANSISILGRREGHLRQVQSSLEKDYPNTKIFSYATDVVDRDSVAKAFDSIRSSVKTVDVLVASAGFSPKLASIKDSSYEDWYTALDVNVKSSINLIKSFLPVASPTAAVLNVTAGAAHVPYIPGFSAYSTSKLAATKIFNDLHYEYPNFQVLSFHPGLIDTGIVGNPNAHNFDDIELPANFAVWAASPEARFLNGKLVWANWDVDELKAMAKEIQDSKRFTIGLLGWL